MATPTSERERILQSIEAWPIEDQLLLAQNILQRAMARVAAERQGATSSASARSTWDALYGIASSGGTPPSDEEVAAWLDEHRMQKYGG